MKEESILKERARLIAQEETFEDVNQKYLEVVEFQIGKEKFGVELNFVGKVNAIECLTKIPGLPNFFRGVINVRGEIIPVLDIPKFFGQKEIAISDASKTIIARHEQTVIGILADDVLGVIKIPENELQTNLSSLLGIQSEYLTGVTLSQIAILDLVKLISDKKIIVQTV